MANATTWRIGGPADLLVRTGHPDKVIAALQWAQTEGLPVTIIGGGSNLLVGDDGIRGLVSSPARPVSAPNHSFRPPIWASKSCGSEWARRLRSHWVGRSCCARGWAGMDWGVGLPGAIGGATVNNAGAHGAEMKDHLETVEIALPDGSVEIARSRVAPAHLSSHQVEGFVPTAWSSGHLGRAAVAKGRSGRAATIGGRACRVSPRTQPTGRCAGSTFTNPPGDYAGRLIEAAGLKDFAIGGVRFSTIHSNFIVNDGSGTAEQVLELIAHAQAIVLDRFGVQLETEIEAIGEFTGRGVA